MQYLLRIFILLIFLAVAAVIDYRNGKIPNNLAFAGMIVGLALSPSLHSLLLKCIGIVFLYFFGMLGLMGMGDIKLWMVIVSFIRFGNSCIIIALAALLLILYGLSNNTKETISIIRTSAWQLRHLKRLEIMEQKRYAFSPFIAASALVYASLVLGRVMLA